MEGSDEGDTIVVDSETQRARVEMENNNEVGDEDEESDEDDPAHPMTVRPSQESACARRSTAVISPQEFLAPLTQTNLPPLGYEDDERRNFEMAQGFVYCLY